MSDHEFQYDFTVTCQQIQKFDEINSVFFVNNAKLILMGINVQYHKRLRSIIQTRRYSSSSSLYDRFGSLLLRTCYPQSSLTDFGSLSWPDFLKMSRHQIHALPLDALRNLALRSRRLVATATFAFDIRSFFYWVPKNIVMYILLEWIDIEDLARFDLALRDRGGREQYLSLLQKKKKDDGVLSLSTRFNLGESGKSDDDRSSETELLMTVSLQQFHDFNLCKLYLYLLDVINLLLSIKGDFCDRQKNEYIKCTQSKEFSSVIYIEDPLQRTCPPQSYLNDFGSLSGPGLLEMSLENIKALSLDALRNLALRSQRLLATATFAQITDNGLAEAYERCASMRGKKYLPIAKLLVEAEADTERAR